MPRPRRFDWLFRPHLADEDLPLSAEARFAEALSELPPVERSALALAEIGGLNEEEIAERLGTEPDVVRKLLHRARASVRTAIAGSSRRGLTALLPLQNWWQTGASAPAVRAAGAVAAAVVGTGVAIGGASADPPRAALTAPDRPTAHTVATRRLEGSPRDGVAAASSPVDVARPAAPASVTVTQSRAGAAKPRAGERANARPHAVPEPERVPAPHTSVPVTQAPTPAAAPPAPPARPTPTERVETVARTLPQPPLPAPAPVVIEPPVAAPVLPVPVPIPAPEIPPVAVPAPPPPPPILP